MDETNERPLTQTEQDIAAFYQTPLGQEIMEVNKEAWIRKHTEELQAKMDATLNAFPLPVRWMVKFWVWIRTR